MNSIYGVETAERNDQNRPSLRTEQVHTYGGEALQLQDVDKALARQRSIGWYDLKHDFMNAREQRCAAHDPDRMSGIRRSGSIAGASDTIAGAVRSNWRCCWSPSGALSGFFAGVFGIGGGAILVPVFYECFRLAGVPLEVRMPLCIGTSLAIIIPTSIRSFRAHYARGAVDMDILKRWWLPIVIGVDRRQRHRALRAGAAVQDRVRHGGVVGRGAAAAGARQLEIRRRHPDRAPDAALWLLRRAALDADGRRRRPVREPADDLLRPADPSGGRDLVGARGADLDPRRARLRLCRLAGGGALSRCRRAAAAVCDRLRLADRRACW